MRVLHVTSAKTRRGGENQLFLLTVGLRNEGIECMTVLPHNAEYDESAECTIRIRFRGETDIPAMSRLRQTMKQFLPDIVHAHTAHAHAWAAGAVGHSAVPLVVSRRVLFPPSRNPLSRWKMKKAGAFICISGAVARSLEEYGIERERIFVVHSGVSMEEAGRSDRDTREKMSVPDEAFLIVNLAAFTPNKDQATLIRAMSLMETDQSVLCVLAGEGRTKQQAEKLAVDLNLRNRIVFPGSIRTPRSLLCSSDLFVLTSVSEGLSTATIEAMAAGLPVIATRCGGVEEVVEDGETGLLVPVSDSKALAEAIESLIGNRELLNSMGKKGLERASLFSVERMVKGTLTVYRALLGIS